MNTIDLIIHNSLAYLSKITPEYIQKHKSVDTKVIDLASHELESLVETMKMIYKKDTALRFISMGGDGTHNIVVNAITQLSSGVQESISLGLIGLGSSNDILKSPQNYHVLEQRPLIRLNFDKARKQYLGIYTTNENNQNTHFVANCSIGITAHGNNIYSNPGFIEEFLKRSNANLMMLYCAIKALFSYKSSLFKITTPKLNLQNNYDKIGITRMKFFSGNLHYPSYPTPKESNLSIHLLPSNSIIKRIFSFISFSKGNFPKSLISSSANEVQIESEDPFLIEFDGELQRAKSISFSSTLSQFKICP